MKLLTSFNDEMLPILQLSRETNTNLKFVLIDSDFWIWCAT